MQTRCVFFRPINRAYSNGFSIFLKEGKDLGSTELPEDVLLGGRTIIMPKGWGCTCKGDVLHITNGSLGFTLGLDCVDTVSDHFGVHVWMCAFPQSIAA
jgi:hypothetical protein